MNTAPQEFDARNIDIARAVHDVQRALSEATHLEYVDLLPYALQRNPAYRAFKQSIALHAPIEQRHSLRKQHGVDFIDHIPCEPNTVPSLFKENHLERGFLLGVHVTQKALGSRVDVEFGDYVTETMHLPTEDPRKYAHFLSQLGESTYAFSLSSDTQQERAVPNPLHSFMQDYAHELYGDHDIVRMLAFKVGAGIARASFNAMSRTIDDELQGIEAASNKPNLEI